VQLKAASAAAPAGANVPTITVGITDVVPLADTDSRGLGLAVASFPIVIGGMLGGIVISLVIAGVWRRLTAAAVYAVGAGFTIVAVMQPWFGILQGDFIVNVGAVALSLFATVAFITGMASLLGRPGIGIGAITTLLIGNPLSAAAQPAQFIPAPWGNVGQWLVPGASTTLLRNLSYFPNASNTFPLLVLAGWAVFGILVTALGHFRSREIAHIPGWDEEPAARPDAAELTWRAPAGMTTFLTISRIAAVTGIATSAPMIPSRVPPASAPITTSEPGTATVLFMMRGVRIYASTCI